MLTVSQNHVAEFAFQADPGAADPFHDVQLDALVTDPAGVTRRVPAFWAGGDVWRVRYSSPLVGEHRLVTECAAIAALDGQQRRLQVLPYRGDHPLYRHGAPQVTADRRRFEHADGTPFLWLGDTWWMAFCQRLAWPDDWKQMVADRVAKGFTVIQIVAGLYPDMPAFDERGANEAGQAWEPNFARIRPAYYDAVDRRFADLVEHGLVPCLVGAWGYFLGWMGVARLQQHWRYLLARYAAWPVFWCVGGEVNLPWYLAEGFPYDDRAAVTGWTAVARYVRQTDPFSHPLSVHPTGLGRLSARGAIDDPELLDFDMLQTGHGHREVLLPSLETHDWSYAAEPRMPVLNSEVAYEMLLDQFRAGPQRMVAWASLLSGAAGHTYGANGLWQCNRADQPHGASPHGGNYGTIPWQDALHLPGSQQLAWAKALLLRCGWPDLAPHPAWATLTGAALDAADRAYCAGRADLRLIYAPSRRPVTLHNLDTAWQATALDPVTFAETPLGRVSAGQTVPPPPGPEEDWLLLLQRA
ncbi:MAG: DUF4038 domain-containing protein [Fimbriimonadaceae bacterium]|nr:DUF4038 domain-containing protein [Fimbriimonadaceae bacterium]